MAAESKSAEFSDLSWGLGKNSLANWSHFYTKESQTSKILGIRLTKVRSKWILHYPSYFSRFFNHLQKVQLLFRRSFARVMYPSHCWCLKAQMPLYLGYDQGGKGLLSVSAVIPLMFSSQKPAKSKQLRLACTPPCLSLILEWSKSVLSWVGAEKHASNATVPSLALNNV